MKRNNDLTYRLLTFFRDKQSDGYTKAPVINGYDELMVRKHLILLYEAGLLRCEPIKSNTSDRVVDVVPFDLTWEGHETLDRMRHSKIRAMESFLPMWPLLMAL